VENIEKDTLKFKYEFQKDTGILFKFYYGNITMNDLISSWEYAIKNNLIPENKKGFLLDYRNATFNFSLTEYNKIPEFYKQHTSIFRDYKIAILTENPKDIVIPILVKEEDYGYQSRPFSTFNAAIEWLLS